ncbi:MAG: type II toxin-antitoxin system HicB family antitoxin [Pseudomonadota bacterium]|nr:type II toxin-antitoxin system HicB family antitoxin [Pseudomonadota bacterium]
MQDEKEYEVILISQPEGGYVATVPELPNVVTEGETREEAIEMARDAIEGYLATMRDHNWTPRPIERVRVSVMQPSSPFARRAV